MIHSNKRSGFTLIELLVVIAIIGILSSVVLASLNSARTKGSDASVKAQMSNIAVQAEVYYDSATGGNGDYDDMCTGDPVIDNAVDQIDANDGGTAVCNDSGQNWAVYTTLKGGGTWCVDNSGWKKAGNDNDNDGVCVAD